MLKEKDILKEFEFENQFDSGWFRITYERDLKYQIYVFTKNKLCVTYKSKKGPGLTL